MENKLSQRRVYLQQRIQRLDEHSTLIIIVQHDKFSNQN